MQGVTDYAIYMLDPEGHVTNWNTGAERIKGYAADEIVGAAFLALLHAGRSDSAHALDRRWRRPSARAAYEAEGGASARTARGSGPAS